MYHLLLIQLSNMKTTIKQWVKECESELKTMNRVQLHRKFRQSYGVNGRNMINFKAALMEIGINYNKK